MSHAITGHAVFYLVLRHQGCVQGRPGKPSASLLGPPRVPCRSTGCYTPTAPVPVACRYEWLLLSFLHVRPRVAAMQVTKWQVTEEQ